MKTNRIAAILFTILIVAACSDQQDLSNPVAGGEIASEEPGVDNEINSFDLIVTEMLTTSPRFEQLTKGLYSETLKNEALSYGIIMVGSPNKQQDITCSISRSYDFSVYRVSEQGKLNIGYFTFNPKNKQLYEYNEANGQLKAIIFDSDLLLKYEMLLSTNEKFVN